MRQGGLRDAILHSAGANADHGVRRSNADKRRAILLLLEDDEWSKWSDREIGRQCKVDGKTVTRLREELAQAHLRKSADSPRLVERGGTTYPMKPRQRSAELEPEPSAPAEDEAQCELPGETPAAGEAQADEPATGAEASPELTPVIRLTDALAAQFRREAE